MMNAKVLILVLSSPLPQYQLLKRGILETWGDDSVYDLLFYYGGFSKTSYDPVGRNLFCRSPHECIDNIGYKTLEAFDFVLNNFDYDYVFRTNSSSFLNTTQLREWVEKEIYPRGVDYSGLITYHNQYKFASGCGYLISREYMGLAIKLRNLWDHSLIDDVALGKLLCSNGVEIFNAPRIDINEIRHNNLYFYGQPVSLKRENFHYRCKSEDPERKKDVEIFYKIKNFLKESD